LVAASAAELGKVKLTLIRAQADLEHASTGVDPQRIRLEATVESMEVERARLKGELADTLAARDKAKEELAAAREEASQQRQAHRDEMERRSLEQSAAAQSTTAAAAELRSERDRVAADAVQKEQTLVVFREQATRDSELLRADMHSLQADLTGADGRRRRALLTLCAGGSEVWECSVG
jgi:hypothetical protein